MFIQWKKNKSTRTLRAHIHPTGWGELHQKHIFIFLLFFVYDFRDSLHSIQVFCFCSSVIHLLFRWKKNEAFHQPHIHTYHVPLQRPNEKKRKKEEQCTNQASYREINKQKKNQRKHVDLIVKCHVHTLFYRCIPLCDESKNVIWWDNRK